VEDMLHSVLLILKFSTSFGKMYLLGNSHAAFVHGQVLVLQSMFPSDFVAINEAGCELSAYMVCILLLDVKLASLSLLCSNGLRLQ
jgi:hypothetical protein